MDGIKTNMEIVMDHIFGFILKIEHKANENKSKRETTIIWPISSPILNENKGKTMLSALPNKLFKT